MVPLGLAQAATVRVAYQLGQQKPDRAGRAGFVAVVLGGLFMLGSAVVLWTVLRLLIGFYVELADPGNQALIAIALQLLVIAALFQLFDGVQVIASGALRGYRDTTIPMVIAAIGYWVSISSWLSFPGRKRSNICLFSSCVGPVIRVPPRSNDATNKEESHVACGRCGYQVLIIDRFIVNRLRSCPTQHGSMGHILPTLRWREPDSNLRFP